MAIYIVERVTIIIIIYHHKNLFIGRGYGNYTIHKSVKETQDTQLNALGLFFDLPFLNIQSEVCVPCGAIKCELLPLLDKQVILIGLIDGVMNTCSSDTKLLSTSTSVKKPLIVP